MSTVLTDAPGSYADPSGMVVQPGASVVPQPLRLPRNPTLPQHPLGAYTDAEYEAAVAQLRAQTQQQYNDVLRQLGYTDGNGNFVMGSAETDANRQRSDAQYQEDRARENVTHEMQQAGTLFSGYRGTREGRDTMPYEQTKAQIGIDLPNMLSQLHEKANGIVQDFILQHNQLLAAAAQRATQAAINSPGGLGDGSGTDPNAAPTATGGPPGGTTDLTTPPPDPTLIPPSTPTTGIQSEPAGAASAPTAGGAGVIAAGNAGTPQVTPPPGVTLGLPGVPTGATTTADFGAHTSAPPGVVTPPPTLAPVRVPTAPTPVFNHAAVPSYDPAAVAAAAAAQARRPGMQQ